MRCLLADAVGAIVLAFAETFFLFYIKAIGVDFRRDVPTKYDIMK